MQVSPDRFVLAYQMNVCVAVLRKKTKKTNTKKKKMLKLYQLQLVPRARVSISAPRTALREIGVTRLRGSGDGG